MSIDLDALRAKFPGYNIISQPSPDCGCNEGVRRTKAGREVLCICVCLSAPEPGEAERDAALQRAEQAEAALAQAQAALVPFARLCHADGIELPDLSCDPHEWREAIAHAEAAHQKLKEETR